MSKTIAISIALLLGLSSLAAASTPEQFVESVLGLIQDGNESSYAAAVTKLYQEGSDILPAIQDEIKEHNGTPYANNWEWQALVEASNEIALHRNTRKDLDAWLARNAKNVNNAHAIYINCGNARSAFPGFAFYSLIFRQWPIVLIPPSPLKLDNIFAVHSDGKVTFMPDPAALADFFQTHVKPVAKGGDVVADIKLDSLAWLCLTSVYSADGYFVFTVDGSSVKINKTTNGYKATGRDLVSPMYGDRGQITVTLTFASNGTFESASEQRNVHAGIRPICQATKLRDPDPIVRTIARRDLLTLGIAAKSYLDEQRAKASPELQRAIDELWKQITDEEKELQSEQ